MGIEEALRLLSVQSTILSLYADYISGMSITELAAESSQSEEWIRERIEAARLCLSRQVRIDLAHASLEPASA